MLKPDHTTRTITIKLLVPSLLPRRDVEGEFSEALLIVITTYYYTMLQQLLLHCYYIYVDINCWPILLSCCKTRRKVLVFDRTSSFPSYPGISVMQSTIQPSLPF